ncbi:MAG: D-glycero-beta-D-manno-heptose 1-phosphate adenylyltransferase [Fimbriimonadaceae bacterium]|nr:D-glycero-beta-D-manno-heptose 1-phosphate adenylyltransferase [Fimbriimonadaceae bacterium]QYK57393.1 MAG: D-glycero-beta-D-manno-heptose 1-phosphate adenylyltransferase [Fimbriimonadaceae bacterium]
MIVSVDDVVRARQGRRLVFTNGVFDLLHAGHVDTIEAAKALGDMLVVGLNSDSSANRLGKGPGRPLAPLDDRARVVAALRAVDFVVSFEEDTPVELLRQLKPEIHVKGGDYDPESLPETPVVRAFGGAVVVVPFLYGRSTTALIEKIRRSIEG